MIQIPLPTYEWNKVFCFSHAIANKIKIEINVFSDTRYILYLAIKDFLFFTKMQDMSGWIKHVTLYVKNFSFYFDIKTVALLLSKAVNRRLVCISYELVLHIFVVRCIFWIHIEFKFKGMAHPFLCYFKFYRYLPCYKKDKQ